MNIVYISEIHDREFPYFSLVCANCETQVKNVEAFSSDSDEI